MVVILDNIRSVFNVASIFRTADALGIEKIILCGVTPAPVDRFGRKVTRFTKVSLGAEKSVAWEHEISTESAIRKLKERHFFIIAVERHSQAVSYTTFKINRANKNYALVVGSETKGLPDAILSQSDIIIDIPQKGIKESLNVSIAFAIVAAHLEHSSQ